MLTMQETAVGSSHGSVTDAVIARATAAPAVPAVVHGDRVVTYGQLLDLARRLADRLRAAGVGEQVAVASCLPRGPALVTSILGIWMAGGVYVPMDPGGPLRRQAHILRDSRAQAVIGTAGTAEGLPAGKREIVVVDSFGAPLEAADCGSSHAVGGTPACARQASAPGDLAYVIYTSGTTGNPKGVMVEHASLAALASALERVLGPWLAEVRRVALNAAATFDVFFADFVNLAFGRTLFVADDQSRRDPERLARFITDNNIEFFNGTPTQIRAVLRAGEADALASLRLLVLAGEAIDPVLWRDLRGLPGVSVHNFYGPTETTVYVVSAALAEHSEPVIGQALPDCQAWVAGPDLRPVPDGETGEICIAGRQVARGYIGQDPADPPRFAEMPPPGSDVPVRTYRTGDKGRRNEAGQLEFLGRLDDQVKISGHRIELREVETVMRGCPGVKEAVVAAPDSGNGPALGAWVVVEAGTSNQDVREWLATTLPSYMMPKLTCVPAIPTRPSGKADVAALVRLSTQTPDADQGAGDCRVGDSLRRIWCEALGVASVTDADDFFALGGNSLKATNVIMATRAAMTPGVPIRVIFDHPEFGAYVKAINNLVLEGRRC